MNGCKGSFAGGEYCNTNMDLSIISAKHAGRCHIGLLPPDAVPGMDSPCNDQRRAVKSGGCVACAPQPVEIGGMKALPGTYALVLRNRHRASIQVGRWGHLAIQPGYYIYIGSAFGPGGVRARVSRHCRAAKTRYWHIDYLRECTAPIAVWCSYHPTRLEHRWARGLEIAGSTMPVAGFGCTDCRCAAHLFFTRQKPELAAFTALMGGASEACACEPSG